MVLYKYGTETGHGGQLISGNLFAQLQRDIIQGKLRSGEKLTEQRICVEYGVSRTPVREALRELESQGLIESIPNRGAFVIGFTEQEFYDMYELRKVYEVQAVKWAIQRMTKEEFEELEETFEFMEFYTQKNDIEKMLNINVGFHQLIYTAARNRLLKKMLSSYQLFIKYGKKEQSYGEDYLSSVLEEHRAIFEAFRDRNADAAVKAMENHLDMAIHRRRAQEK